MAEQAKELTAEQIDGSIAVANYVASMSNELSGIARRNGLDTLGYLLDMVRLEAESLARQDGRGGRRS